MKTENTTAVGIIIKSNIKIVEGGKIDISTNKYMTALGYLAFPSCGYLSVREAMIYLHCISFYI
jgi:hypothetical protein